MDWFSFSIGALVGCCLVAVFFGLLANADAKKAKVDNEERKERKWRSEVEAAVDTLSLRLSGHPAFDYNLLPREQATWCISHRLAVVEEKLISPRRRSADKKAGK
jgi:hypothetical protein